MTKLTMQDLDPQPEPPRTFGRYVTEEAARKGGEWHFGYEPYHTLKCDVGWRVDLGPLPPNATGKTYTPVVYMEESSACPDRVVFTLEACEVVFEGHEATGLATEYELFLREKGREFTADYGR